MGKLTKRTIEALAPRDVDYITWDRDVPGFGVRVMPSGRKSFVLQYRVGRRSRRMVLGYCGVLTPEQARAKAIHNLAALRDGDQWCVCAMRWKEAFDAGRACPVVLESTHVSALEYVDLADLEAHAVPGR